MPADDHLVLPVPELVRATYLVPTTVEFDDPVGYAREICAARWSGALRHLLADLLAGPVAPVRVLRSDDIAPLPIDLLADMGATEEQLARIAGASHVLVVTVASRPGWPPAHEWAARAIATALAEHVSGDVLDLPHHQVLSPAQAALTVPDGESRPPLAGWVSIDYSPARAGYWCTTTGLRRFGLPELQSLAVPPNVVDQWGRTMTAIAHRLVSMWTTLIDLDQGVAFVQLPAMVAVSADDVAAAYLAEAPSQSPPAMVRLVLDPVPDPGRHSYLTIHPPLEWPGSAGEHITEVCAALFGARSSEVRRVSPSDVMDRAIAIARSGLTEIRARFESGSMGPQLRLLVKYNAPAEEGNEYLWAYVTSWRDPYRILATSADNAVYHPHIRRGRPVVVDSAAVVDWAVADERQGIVEGGWTQAALDEG
jgi:hypothetical protein